MGIKSIHIVFISASVLMSVIFGIWGLTHGYQVLGYAALATAIALGVYGVKFVKKAKAL